MSQRISLASPFRLDLTVSALRRRSINLVDVFTAEGVYVRALDGNSEIPVIVKASQWRNDKLCLSVSGAGDRLDWAFAATRTMLGLDYDLAQFEHAVRPFPWLSTLFRQMQGLRPPRYPTLWEAFVNTIVFQQISIAAATAITNRVVLHFGRAVEVDGIQVYSFPDPWRVLDASDATLRAAGLSTAKIATLRRAADALLQGTITTSAIIDSPAAEASRMLQQIKGIGPWSAAVILIRGAGRLDFFPPGDSSVIANLRLVGGPTHGSELARLLDALGPQRGMLYFLLLAARLDQIGDLGTSSQGAA